MGFCLASKVVHPGGIPTKGTCPCHNSQSTKTSLVAHGCCISVPGRTISRARLWCHRAVAQNTRYQNISAPSSVLENPYLSVTCGCPSSQVTYSVTWHILYALLLGSVQQGFLHACCAWELPAERLFPVSVVASLSHSQRSYNSMSNKYLQLTMATFTEWVTHKMWSGRVYTVFFSYFIAILLLQ